MFTALPTGSVWCWARCQPVLEVALRNCLPQFHIKSTDTSTLFHQGLAAVNLAEGDDGDDAGEDDAESVGLT